MKLNRKIGNILITAVTVVFFSCSTQEKKPENVLYEVEITDAVAQKTIVNLSEIAEKDVEYIALDSDKDHLLAQSPYFYLNGNEIIACTRKQMYAFDRATGKFLREIGHYGEDPGGYKKVPQAFVFDEQRQLFYTGGWDPKSYCRYGMDGSFTDKITAYSIDKEGDEMNNVFGEIVTSIAPLNDTCFVGYVWNIDGKQEAKLIVFNENNHRIRIFPQDKHFDYDIQRDGISVFSWNAKFYQQDQQLHFFERFTDTVYTATIDTLLPKFVLHRGETENATATNFAKNEGAVPYAMVENIFESERYLFFKIRMGKTNEDSKFYYGYFDKKDGVTKVSFEEAGFENDMDNFIPLKFYSANSQNEIVGSLDAYEVKLWFDENPEKAKELSPKLQHLKNMNETDNPVVMIAKLKE